MRRNLVLAFLASLAFCTQTALYAQDNTDDAKTVRVLFDETLKNGDSYRLLDELCNRIGPRLSGSEGAAKAVEWGKRVMESLGFDRVYLQEVMVPHWERGEKEQARIVGE
ncbi:MAG: peptidase M28 family protein, partial [candidate division Zixibacteria bacterium]|nr:peptidase M28 family protein [candidate division Zixibacteria bacterium]